MVSLIPTLVSQIYRINGTRLGIHYGSNRVRFPAPVRVGSRVRARARLTVIDVPDSVQVVTAVTVKIEEEDKPACFVERVTRLYS